MVIVSMTERISVTLMNNIVTTGRLGADPVLSYTSGGKGYTSFSLADDVTFGSGENRKKETVWMRCTIWSVGDTGKQAETAAEILHKGDVVTIEGRLKPDPETGGPKLFTNKEGQQKATYEVAVNQWRTWASKGQTA